MKSKLGWSLFWLCAFVVIWGAARSGFRPQFQVDVEMGHLASDLTPPALQKLAALLPQKMRATTFRVRWQHDSEARALHFNRDDQTLDYYVNQQWQEGYDGVTDTLIVAAAKRHQPIGKLPEYGATKSKLK